MSHKRQSNNYAHFYRRLMHYSIIVCIVLQVLCFTGNALGVSSVQRYKMVSVVEYSGKSQFRNQAETLVTVKKEEMAGGKVQYYLSGTDLNPNMSREYSILMSSFVLDRNTKYMSGSSEDINFWQKINNESVSSLEKVSREQIGKTWKQSIDLSSFGNTLPNEMNFTLTAIEIDTEMFGKMIAVRALSEPFNVEINQGSLRAKINSVYLFDQQIEDIYLSISVFEGTTNSNGFKEILRHEVATYKTDSNGNSVDLTGIGEEFEKIVRKVGLSRDKIEIKEEAPLPRWAQSNGLTAAQAANICASVACEGAFNPVITVCIPAARVVAMQSIGEIPSIGAFAIDETVAGTLGKSVPGIGTMKIAVAPAFLGANWATAGIIAGGTAGGVAAGGGFDSDSSSKIASPR